ncbi:hypothetical protein PC116_g18588 [Phytophthora cactorum]|nr:hypothetical protein Pcac1_g6090 [Phytophthora cactorum]KAG2905570.1 hypothetical protein PC114_g11495 [Phytophthora cactorum]KAG2974109.1 hypothetical protein PC120_g26047 [Phytophthora cactorum]KAG3180340.1 hypothetical protein C6341_g6971 [Phytophthora cactorum]KAG4038011.1 hypothetical protein PC123_g26425 [Phytophthora cactorum]
MNEGAQRANTLIQQNHVVVTRSARVQARLVLRRLCSASMVSSTITWNATPVARRRRQGRNQYLVKWRGYPHSHNSGEFEVPLRQDCPDVVDAYDLAHPLPKRHHGVRWRRQAPSASRR